MGEPAEDLLSRSEIAERAQVRRPAVSNWERRHPDYPAPVLVGEHELFRASEIESWLSGRRIPARSLLPDERPGATFGERFRRTNAGGAPPEYRPRVPAMVAESLLGGTVGEWFVRAGQEGAYATTLLLLLHLRGRAPVAWARLRNAAAHGTGGPLGPQLLTALDHRPEPAQVVRLSESSPAPRGLLDTAVLLIDTLHRGREVAETFERVLLEDARRRGKRGGEHTTPPSVGRIMTALLALATTPADVYDPYCRSGELLVAAGTALTGPDGRPPTVSGGTSNAYHQLISTMNLALHGIDAKVLLTDRLPAVRHDRGHDAVLSNPPFSLKVARGNHFEPEAWPWGEPPEHNADLGWIQLAVSALSPNGRATVVMPYGAAFRTGREQAIRAALVEDGAVECVIALPPSLFLATTIPVTVWVLRAPTAGRDADLLFVDASRLGSMETRALRKLSDDDVAAVVAEYRSWRDGGRSGRPYEGVEGFSRRVDIEEIRAAGHSLAPSRYVHPVPDPSDTADTTQLLTAARHELIRLQDRARLADEQVALLLEGLDTWTV